MPNRDKVNFEHHVKKKIHGAATEDSGVNFDCFQGFGT